MYSIGICGYGYIHEYLIISTASLLRKLPLLVECRKTTAITPFKVIRGDRFRYQSKDSM